MAKAQKIILQSQRQIFSLTICCGLILLEDFAFSPTKRNLPEIPLGEGKPSKPGCSLNQLLSFHYFYTFADSVT